jgi:hypothetical protein
MNTKLYSKAVQVQDVQVVSMLPDALTWRGDSEDRRIGIGMSDTGVTVYIAKNFLVSPQRGCYWKWSIESQKHFEA